MYDNICRYDGRKRETRSRKKKSSKGKGKKEEVVWTFDKIEELGLGQLRMSYENLYDLTPRAFWNAVDGYWLQKENEDRKEWVRTRWQTCLLMNVTLPRKNQITLKKLLPFEWESEQGGDKNDSYKQTLFAYEKMMKKKNIK